MRPRQLRRRIRHLRPLGRRKGDDRSRRSPPGKPRRAGKETTRESVATNRSPARATDDNPRQSAATPWGCGPAIFPSPERAAHFRLAASELVRPCRVGFVLGRRTQGVALGYPLAPRWGWERRRGMSAHPSPASPPAPGNSAPRRRSRRFGNGGQP